MFIPLPIYLTVRNLVIQACLLSPHIEEACPFFNSYLYLWLEIKYKTERESCLRVNCLLLFLLLFVYELSALLLTTLTKPYLPQLWPPYLRTYLLTYTTGYTSLQRKTRIWYALLLFSFGFCLFIFAVHIHLPFIAATMLSCILSISHWASFK